MKLFDQIIDNQDLHPHFKTVMGDVKEPERQELMRWAYGFPDRDGKFVKEFQSSFNSCLWELYLFAVFKSYNFKFDWTHSSPDFHIISDRYEFIVEATTSNAAKNKINEWDKIYDYEDMKKISFNELNIESIIRLSNSITTKHKYFQKHYSKLNHVKNKPFVLALAPFEQPYFNLQLNRAIMALLYDYYVDEDAYLESPGSYPDGPPVKQLGFVEKDNGANIPLGFFNDDQISEISAIIYSCTATWGKLDAVVDNNKVERIIESVWSTEPNGEPKKRTCLAKEYEESLTDGIQIYYNPYAKNPLPPEIFRRRGVLQCIPNTKTKTLIEEESTRNLLFRHVTNIKK